MSECLPCSFFRHSDGVLSMAFSSFAFSNLSFLLDCGVNFLWCYLQGSVDCKCQVTSLWVEFINTVSLFAPVDLAGGWEKE